MNIAAYLDRIRVSRPVRPDLATLDALHRAHLKAIPFENLDVQLGRPVSQDRDAVFDKLVRRHRGGWCYEMNGLFGWTLKEIGFDVTRLSAGVMRGQTGDANMGSHLCLLVRLPDPYLVDVGFGGAMRAPLPLVAGQSRDPPYLVSLSQTDDGYWRFAEKLGADAPFTFDFRAEAADEAQLAARCTFLQRDAASPFVQNLVVQRRGGGGVHITLRGRVLTHLSTSRAQPTLLQSADELVRTLRDTFGIEAPEAANLWPRVCARHAQLFGV